MRSVSIHELESSRVCVGGWVGEKDRLTEKERERRKEREKERECVCE
jgi:hypothetical protein